MAWCHQATSHYLSQCRSRSTSPYAVTRPQWVKIWSVFCLSHCSAVCNIMFLDRVRSRSNCILEDVRSVSIKTSFLTLINKFWQYKVILLPQFHFRKCWLVTTHEVTTLTDDFSSSLAMIFRVWSRLNFNTVAITLARVWKINKHKI